jgi:hypothetical protein
LTLASDIIRDAYRESNLIAINANPTDAEQTEALTLLNRIIASVYGNEVGEKFTEVLIGRNNIGKPQGYPWYDGVPPYAYWVVPHDVRLILNLTQPETVYLNPTPEDGDRFSILDASGNLATYNFTIVGNGRNIEGATSVTKSTNGDVTDYLYRADLGNWVKVAPLIVSDTFPFPTEFEDLFIVNLAMRLNPRNGSQIDPQSIDRAKSLMTKFRARYTQIIEVGTEEGINRLPSNKRRRYADSRRNNAEFDTGYPNRFR